MGRKGFAPIIIFLIIAGFLIVGGIWYYAVHQSTTSQPQISNQPAPTQQSTSSSNTSVVTSSSPSSNSAITSPSTGNEWAIGSSHTITWSPKAFSATTLNIGLVSGEICVQTLSIGGLCDAWQTIASSTPNSGSYTWIVSNPAFAGDYGYRIQIGEILDNGRASYVDTSGVFSIASSTSNWKSYDMGDSGITFLYPPNWTVSSLNSSTVGLYSPSTTAALNSGNVETSFDISISAFDNSNGTPLHNFVDSYQNGWFTTYNSSTVVGVYKIIKDDSQSAVPSTPAIATFIQTQPGCASEIVVVTLTNSPNAQQRTEFNAIVNSVYDYICAG